MSGIGRDASIKASFRFPFHRSSVRMAHTSRALRRSSQVRWASLTCSLPSVLVITHCTSSGIVTILKGMPISGHLQIFHHAIFHHANEVRIVPGNEFPYWFRRGSRGPAAIGNGPAASSSSNASRCPNTRSLISLMANAEFVIALVNHDLRHIRSLFVVAAVLQSTNDHASTPLISLPYSRCSLPTNGSSTDGSISPLLLSGSHRTVSEELCRTYRDSLDFNEGLLRRCPPILP